MCIRDRDVVWGDVDYMFIDMPPGTGDVPLTVFQSIAIDGIIIVTSPQELVGKMCIRDRSMYGNIAKAHSKDKKTRYYYYCKNTVTPTGHECSFLSLIHI